MDKTDVLIAGLGPVGAALGVYLARSGVKVTVVEKTDEVYPMPRAAHLDHETMRLLDLAGGAEAVAGNSQPLSSYEFRNAKGELLLGFRPRAALADTGWPYTSMFHQPTLEIALREVLSAEPSASVRLGVSLVGYTDGPDGVTAEIEGPDGETQIAARYLVGCDGGQSTVRRLAGIGLDDMGFDEPWLVIDTLLKNGTTRLSTIGLQHCDPARPVTSMPMAPGRHRWEFMLLEGETPEEVMTDEAIDAMIAPFADPKSLSVERRAVYRFHAVFAERWRDGHVILAGDAAHQMPPFMGQGLCSGARDAANLGWKLAAVIKGEADQALLDSFQPEREPHVRDITEMAVSMGRIVCTQDEAEAAARDAGMMQKPEAERFDATPTLRGMASGVIEGGGAVAPALIGKAGERPDRALGMSPLLVVAKRADAPADTGDMQIVALDEHEGEGVEPFLALMGDAPAMLVRPDRYVFGTGEPASLLTAWAAYLKTGRAGMQAAA
ncbi:bifunctional 3-(3-hydroxy-phenyl)propionate/3-hydroxycinnamic acid hydroxylase [Parvibaculum sp. MBR-TMA-1.3b-4.2]|jgi:3-(3-hydroxy-phenyl)propionate hydroxylase